MIASTPTHGAPSSLSAPASQLACTPPVVEHRRTGADPEGRLALGVGVSSPSLSWSVTAAPPGWELAACEIEETREDGSTSTAHVEAAPQTGITWPFEPLRSRERRELRVRVLGRDGSVSPWSEPTIVEAGLLSPEDWCASLVGPALDGPLAEVPVLLRTSFVLPDAPIRRARLYSSAHGVYELELNGARVGDEELSPGWTAYESRLAYQVHEIPVRSLQAGENVLGAWLADGWWRGHLGWGGKQALYGEEISLLAQLEVELDDGARLVVATGDAPWRTAAGPITVSDLYNGEEYDARLLPAGWSRPGFDDASWEPVQARPTDPGRLVAVTAPPVRVVASLPVQSMTTAPSGETILDFGQNIAGRLRLRASGPEGTVITMRHAEVLQDGELAVEPLRSARATDRLVLGQSAQGAAGWAPRFTTHGFRYAGITGWPGELDPAAVTAEVLATDMLATGQFASSDAELDRLHANVEWSFRGNSVAVPTDCPQRDERLGWTGDLQVFAPTAAFLADTATFHGSWMEDLAAEQTRYGATPSIVPAVTMGASGPMAAWCDVATILPWTLYEATGDLDILRRSLDAMRAWVREAVAAAGPDHVWVSGFQYGDWLDPTAPAGRPEAAATPAELVATAYLARSTRILADTLALLATGPSREADDAARLAQDVASAFRGEYVTGAGRLLSDSPTAYALAIAFDLLAPAQRKPAGERLDTLVRANDFKVATGFVGTPIICHALTATGHSDTAFKLLMNPGRPGWIAEVRAGATTTWERWDSLLPDGTVNPSGMTSFNHYALGAVADWMHRSLAGLAPAAPGWSRIRVAPQVPRRGLASARAATLTPFGRAQAGWRLEDGEVVVEIDVPVGALADVVLPSGAERSGLGHGHHVLTEPFETEHGPSRGYTLDTPLREMEEDEEAVALVIGVVVKHVPEAAEHMGGSLAGAGSTTPRQIMGMLPDPDAACHDVELGLSALNAFAPLPEGLLEPLATPSEDDGGLDDGLEELASLLGGATFWETHEGDGLPALVLSDGPHGVRRQLDAADNLGLAEAMPATCFPTGSTLACSWDAELVSEVGRALGEEARERGVDILLGPGVNIRRSPLGGRGFEYLSEDPAVSGVLACAYVEGVQSTGVGTALKHFALNSQETDRLQVSADVDERTLREVYLPAFERVVTRARPTMVMSAYNAVNGVFSSENHWLLTEVLRDEWGFDGAVVSDWGAVKDRVEALRAGLDLEMPSSDGAGAAAIVEAVRSGDLDRSVLEQSAQRLRRVAARVLAGRADGAARRAPSDHHELARRAAAESLVLLRNEDETLPLIGVPRLALLGALAATPSFQGGGSSQVNAARVDSLADELAEALPGTEIRTAAGYGDGDADESSTELLAEAVGAASWAGTAVIVVGEPETRLSEGFDRRGMELPEEQIALIEAVVDTAERTIVIIEGGGVVLLGDWVERVDAVLECFAAGEGLGGAVARVLSGAVSPSGRLTESIPMRLEDTPAYLTFPGTDGHARHGEGVFVGYRYYETVGREARYPFGYGLSYTTFEESDLVVKAREDGRYEVRARVTNTGGRPGSHVVQAYVAPLTPGPVRRPVRELRAFTKVHLEPGESTAIALTLDRRDLAYWDAGRGRWWVQEGRYAVELRPNAHDAGLTAVVEVPGDTERPAAVTPGSSVGEWFAHPVAGPALMELMAAGVPEDQREAASAASDQLAMVASMPMDQFIRFPMVPVTDADLVRLAALCEEDDEGEEASR